MSLQVPFEKPDNEYEDLTLCAFACLQYCLASFIGCIIWIDLLAEEMVGFSRTLISTNALTHL